MYSFVASISISIQFALNQVNSLIIFSLSQKRATIRTQDYFFHQISNTPFSLGIAWPRDYGKWRVHGLKEVLLATQQGFNSKLYQITLQGLSKVFLLALFQNVTNVIYNFQSPNSLLERTGVCIQTGFTASIIMPEISMSLKTLKKR